MRNHKGCSMEIFMMKLLDIATEYADLNIFNADTYATVVGKTKVFCERTGVVNIDDVNFSVLAKFKKLLLSTAKPVTYNGYIRYLRIVVDYAIEREYTSKNLFREIKLAPEGIPPPKIMESDTIKALCDHIMDKKAPYGMSEFWLAVVSCLFYTGMRRRQLVSLRLSAVDFNEKLILLSYEGSKTKRSWSIPLHDDLAIRLEEFIYLSEKVMNRRMRPDDFLFVASRFNPRFVTTKNGAMRADAITGFFKRLSKVMDIRVGAHRFRHTFATDLCNPEDETPPDIFAVQAMLGHTDVQTTRKYVHTSVKRMESTLNRLSVPF